MAIPLVIPIIMAVAAMGAGVAQGISERKNAKAEAEALEASAAAQVDERARNAKKLMSQQKTSFLKSGVYFSGSPQDIINETYMTYQKDLSDMLKDTGIKTKNLTRAGKTAFYSSLLKGISNAASSFMGAYGGSAGSAAGSSASIGSKIANSKIGTSVQNWYNSAKGLNTGGFGQVQTTNSLPTKNGNLPA